MKGTGEEVRSEIARIADAIEALAAGTIGPEEFRRRRVIQGIYPVRGGTDRYLLRIRIPLGRPAPSHLRAIADAADRFAGGRPVHVTTRQDVHVYGVEIRSIPDALAFLADAALTTREACGDTVRNTVVCPHAGIAPAEIFDVSPYADALARHLLRNPLGQQLPRKFKIAFEGCAGVDHVDLACHDVGARAILSPDGIPGFRVTLAGGLGALPQAGVELEPFTPIGDLVPTVEAVLRIFDRLGDRERRGRARLKFVARKLGEEVFREAVRTERENVRAAPPGARIALPEPVVSPGIHAASGAEVPEWPGAIPQRRPEIWTLPARVPLGDLSPEQLRRLAILADRAGSGVRFTPWQAILVTDVPDVLVRDAASELRAIGLSPLSGTTLTRCAGTDTCTIGTTRVRPLAARIEKELFPEPDAAFFSEPVATVKVSGCANGCGRHMVADIGLQGAGRWASGRIAPHYMLFLGGGQDENGGIRFGTRVGRIPARRVVEAVKRILDVLRRDAMPGVCAGKTISRLGTDPFIAALGDLLEPSPESYSEQDFLDLGITGSVPFPPDRTGPKAP